VKHDHCREHRAKGGPNFFYVVCFDDAMQLPLRLERAMTYSNQDRWLLPRRQTEYPGRDLLPEETLHGRREGTFLVLAAMFFIATAALLLLGTSRMIDASALLARFVPSVHLPIALLVPLAVIPFALSFVASAMTYDLFGRRRATLLLWIGLLASLALVGVMRGADVLDGGDAFVVSLALTACYLVAHAFNLLAFAALHSRPFFLRLNISSLLAQAAGWSAAALVLHACGPYLATPLAPQQIVSICAGAAACSTLCVLILAIPAAIANSGLSLALRVGNELVDDEDEVEDYGYPPDRPQPDFAQGSVARKLPAMLVEEDDVVVLDEAARRRTLRGPGPQPFSSAEMRFFSEGDAAHEGS
jgi:uncharacterized PurR-regulated membrane protein YhhQ (DUF165 family)